MSQALSGRPPPDGANTNAPGKKSARIQEKSQANCPTAEVKCEALSPLRSQLQARGYLLFELADSSFIASRWGITVALPDLHSVARFARSAIGAANV